MWNVGDAVALREVWHDRLWRAQPAIVVEDHDDQALFHIPPGVRWKGPATAGDPVRIPHGEWQLVDRTWPGPRVLSFAWPGVAHAVLALWDGSGEFSSWYINLQTPLRRTAIGFDYTDHTLDVIVEADLSSWRWKDEDELEEAVSLGFYSHIEAAEFRAEGERAVQRLLDREPPFDRDWRDWRPDPSWPMPELPPGWEIVTSDEPEGRPDKGDRAESRRAQQEAQDEGSRGEVGQGDEERHQHHDRAHQVVTEGSVDAAQLKLLLGTWIPTEASLGELEGDAYPLRLGIESEGGGWVEIDQDHELPSRLVVRTAVVLPTPHARVSKLRRIVADVVMARAGLLQGTVEPASGSVEVRLAHAWYADDFSRHTLMAAITEVTKARRQLDQVLGQAGMVVGEAHSAARTQAPAVAPKSVTPSAPSWLATHTVPPTGIRAWAEPNPTLPPIADLASGVELRLLERLGDWARVEASNGWTGWVDARLLVPAAP